MIKRHCRETCCSSQNFMSRAVGSPSKWKMSSAESTYVISELKPALTKIISQGIACGEIHFDYPSALAEIVLIVLAVKFDNSLIPSPMEETADTIKGLISLLEKGTGVPAGALEYLSVLS